MRIVVEAMCAEFGGIRTYVEHLLAKWSEAFPEDELHVIVPIGSSLPTAGHVRHEIAVRRPASIGRPLAQTKSLRRLTRQLNSDAVLATLPSTTVLKPGRPMAVVLYDLRHELRPEQFSRKRRILRRISYSRGYQLADGIISISQRSLDDLHERHPSTRATPSAVAHLGADHVEQWPSPAGVGPCVTFAHHTNKNVGLLVDGWSELVRRGGDVPPLLMLGVPRSQQDELIAQLTAQDLNEYVQLAPFLPEDRFQQVMAEAEMVVFPTDFEGFGLPVVEGMLLGSPVVIGPERATNEIAGGHATIMSEWSPTALADAVTAAGAMTADQREAARDHAAAFTWVRTVRQTRAMLMQLAATGSSPGS
ncbi:glycosyltransferase [Aeromicrobium sp. P5_D10]